MAEWTGDDNNNSHIAPEDEYNVLYGRGGNDYLYGGALADRIISGSGNDYLYGNQGDDFLSGLAADNFDIKYYYGGAGDDWLEAGRGTDNFDGEAGDDTVSYAWVEGRTPEGVTVNLLTGKGSGGFAEGDTYRRIENVYASHLDDFLIGNGGTNYLEGRSGNDRIRGGFGGDILEGGSGIDTLDYVDSNASVIIDLSTGEAYGGYAEGDTFYNFEDIIGSKYSDTLRGDANANRLTGGDGNDNLNGREGADVLVAGNGNDRLIGGLGADRFYGGAGADTFVFQTLADSGFAVAERDMIMDFSRAQGDKIDLTAIDADTQATGNQAFSFAGTGGFTGINGQISYTLNAGDAIVFGDVNGDRRADFAFRVENVTSLAAGDFVL